MGLISHIELQFYSILNTELSIKNKVVVFTDNKIP